MGKSTLGDLEGVAVLGILTLIYTGDLELIWCFSLKNENLQLIILIITIHFID